jgi:hypothetical protein
MSDISAGQHHGVPSGANQPPADVDLDRVWLGIATEVWHRTPGRLEGATGRLLRSPGLARALLTTPSLLIPYLVASAVVLAAGGAVTVVTGTPLVALIAPGIAGIGVAYAYGPGIDPAWELSCSTTVSQRMVLLVRTVAVFALNGALGLAASAISWDAAGITFGWLVPMTSVSALALAVAVVTRSPTAGAAAGIASWTITVLAGWVAAGSYTVVVTDSALVVPYLAVTAGCCLVVALASRLPAISS